eukprot:9500258-Pyramimonas_sp.AAC.1
MHADTPEPMMVDDASAELSSRFAELQLAHTTLLQEFQSARTMHEHKNYTYNCVLEQQQAEYASLLQRFDSLKVETDAKIKDVEGHCDSQAEDMRALRRQLNELEEESNGYAVLSILHAALITFRLRHPNITELFLNTDGANCYSGKYLALSLIELSRWTGMKILSHNTGEPGKNKSELDAHFAIASAVCIEGIATGQGSLDATSAHNLLKAHEHTGGLNSTVAHEKGVFAAITSYSCRRYVYDDSGAFKEMRLHRQTGMGEGVVITATQLRNCWLNEPQQPTGCIAIDANSKEVVMRTSSVSSTPNIVQAVGAETPVGPPITNPSTATLPSEAVGAETTGVTPGPRTNAQPQVPSSKKDGVRRKRLQRMQSKGTVTAAKFRVKPNLQAESVIRK